jgi:hypothetical protein
MTFAEWFAEGAAFGFRAFFAVFVFVLCSGIALMLFGLIASFFGGDEDDMDRD